MKKILTLLLLTLALCQISQAQNKPKTSAKSGANAQYKGHQLTVYSEDGLPFYLILNGVQQNKEASPSVKLIDLEMEYYRAKIVFEDENVKGFTKNLQLQGVDKGWYALVYPIIKNKKGEFDFPGVLSGKIMFHKLDGNADDDFDIDNNPSTDNPWEKEQVNYSYTTTTPKEVDASQLVKSSVDMMNAAMNMSTEMMKGMGGNVNVTGSTTTTTTSTNSGGTGTNSNQNNSNQNNSNHNNSNQNNNTGNSGGNSGSTTCMVGMSIGTFNSILANVKSKSFDEDKAATVQRAIKNNCFTSQQLASLIKQITFEETRLNLAKPGYKKVVDRDNFQLVRDLFTFDSNKEELDQYIDSIGGN